MSLFFLSFAVCHVDVSHENDLRILNDLKLIERLDVE